MSRPVGIFPLLDDECKLGQRGGDKNWAKRLNEIYLPNKKQETSDNTRYSATAMQQVKGIFSVRHFAGLVQYTGADANSSDESEGTERFLARIEVIILNNLLVLSCYFIC